MDEQTIERGRSYKLDDFRRIIGVGRDGFRQAVRNGLVVKQFGRRKYIAGDDWHNFLAARPAVPSFTRPAP